MSTNNKTSLKTNQELIEEKVRNKDFFVPCLNRTFPKEEVFLGYCKSNLDWNIPPEEHIESTKELTKDAIREKEEKELLARIREEQKQKREERQIEENIEWNKVVKQEQEKEGGTFEDALERIKDKAEEKRFKDILAHRRENIAKDKLYSNVFEYKKLDMEKSIKKQVETFCAIKPFVEKTNHKKLKIKTGYIQAVTDAFIQLYMKQTNKMSIPKEIYLKFMKQFDCKEGTLNKSFYRAINKIEGLNQYNLMGLKRGHKNSIVKNSIVKTGRPIVCFSNKDKLKLISDNYKKRHAFDSNVNSHILFLDLVPTAKKRAEIVAGNEAVRYNAKYFVNFSNAKYKEKRLKESMIFLSEHIDKMSFRCNSLLVLNKIKKLHSVLSLNLSCEYIVNNILNEIIFSKKNEYSIRFRRISYYLNMEYKKKIKIDWGAKIRYLVDKRITFDSKRIKGITYASRKKKRIVINNLDELKKIKEENKFNLFKFKEIKEYIKNNLTVKETEKFLNQEQNLNYLDYKGGFSQADYIRLKLNFCYKAFEK